MSSEQSKCKGSLALRNTNRAVITVRLEPWAEEFTIEPGRSVQIAFDGPSEGVLEIELGENIVTVFGWVGSTLVRREPDDES